VQRKTGEIDVAGFRVRYREAGEGRPLLFLHGAAGAEWCPLLDALSAHWRVIAPEHPGFGRSQIPHWMMGIGDLAFFYLDVLRALDLREVHLVGHSVGGWIAAEMAIRNAQRLSSLALFAPMGVAHPEIAFGDIFLWTADEFSRRQFYDETCAQEWRKATDLLDIDIVLQNRAALARLGWHPRLSNPQLPTWLHRIDVPTLLIFGQEDQVVPFACHETFVREIKGAELIALPQSGHALPVERASEIGPSLTAFLQGARG
jgi:pimeloyl-ACP methyl ester carboxylesterase